MVRLLAILLLFLPISAAAQTSETLTPDKLYGQLFVDVQMQRIFPDNKTFVDCIALHPAKEITDKYVTEKDKPGFNLKQFVLQNFRLPASPATYSSTSSDIRKHINALWKVLQRSPDSAQTGSSLIPLPHPYIVPGGRFREIYYWDSYFTMLGLKESGQYGMMENMVKNFAHLIKTYGHIPNGNRSYYVSRSQPPFFSLMLGLLAEIKGAKVYKDYFFAVDQELGYWGMSPSWNQTITDKYLRFTFRHTDSLWHSLNRYSDALSVPRQESYYEDVTIAEAAALEYRKRVRFADSNKLQFAVDSVRSRVWHNLRSAAASGWDFSSRWFIGGKELYNTSVERIYPVDLNCLFYNLQSTYFKSLDSNKSKRIREYTAETRQNFRQLFFNERLGWYCDYDMTTKHVMNNPTLAGMYPLFFRLADKKDVPRIVAFLKKNFLKSGGVVTSLNNSGQQWDAPNGWAPLQWITVIGLENYGYHKLAKEIATRWVKLNKKVFRKTGRLMEKYDVVNINKASGGGEYPTQDGFGWTNGVLLALMNKYGL